MKKFLAIFILHLLIIGCGHKSYTLDDIIDQGAKPVRIHSDSLFKFTEGPVCDFQGRLFFAEYTSPEKAKVYRMDGIDQFTPLLSGAVRVDGLMINQEGNLVVCDYDARKLDLYTPDGVFLETLVDSYNGKPLNGPNDCIADRKGGIYFTDPSGNRHERTQDVEGVYYVTSEKKVVRVAGGFSFPNGIILTPDEKTLLVIDTREPVIRAFDIYSDSAWSAPRTWGMITLGPPRKDGTPAGSGAIGCAMDTEGNLYVATSLGIEVFNSDGQGLGILKFNEFKRASNMTFDRNDPHILYITAWAEVYSLHLKIKGISFPQRREAP